MHMFLKLYLIIFYNHSSIILICIIILYVHLFLINQSFLLYLIYKLKLCNFNVTVFNNLYSNIMLFIRVPTK